MSRLSPESPSQDPRYGQAGRQLARRLAAYLPMTVTRQILSESLVQPGEVNWIDAATLFADISGFTEMAEVLAVDGPRGAETLNRRLLMTFTALINAIHDAGGAVSHFHGDAMMVYFPDTDGRAAVRALGCARFMQSLMLTSYSTFNDTPTDKPQPTFSLTMRIGLGYGRCLETVVGDPEFSMEFVLGGPAIDEAVEAEGMAEAGEVVASREILRMAGMTSDKPFRPVDEVPPVPRATSPLYWDSFSQTAVDNLLRLAPAFMPRVLVERLKNPNTQFIAEHRPATSLFVRFEGINYESKVAGEQLQEYYQHVQTIVARFGSENGRLNRVLMGDKGSHLHIIFGAPMAPDAPEQATRCALALQRNRLEFITSQQIGISAGRVFACAVGSQNRREYTTVGRVVNLSSRLTSLCENGAILMDEGTANRVKDLFVFDTIPNVTVKGVRQPIRLYLPIEEKTVAAQTRSRYLKAQMVPLGREEELEILETYLENGINGKGGAYALYGPYGSGQVSLLASAIHYWQIRRGRVVSGVCQQHLKTEVYSPWVPIWHSLFELSAEMDAAEVKTAVAEFVQFHWPDCEEEAALFGELIGFPQILPTFEKYLMFEDRQQTLFQMAWQLLCLITQNRPLLLIVEDIQWCDSESIKLIDFIASQSHKMPLSIIVTYRESPQFRFLNQKRKKFINPLHLKDLPPEKALALVRKRLKVETLPLLLEQKLGIRDRNGRLSPVNPLFLEESLKFMLTEGVLDISHTTPDSNRLWLKETALFDLQVPDRVYAILLSRLDQLSPGMRSLIQTAAVIGRSFDLKTLVELSPGVPLAEVEMALETLIENDILQRDGKNTEGKFIFRHALAHDVVYQSLPYARRQKLHATIGDLIIREHGDDIESHYQLLAYHFGQTDRHETGLMYALVAGDQAAAQYKNEEASNFFRRAIYHLALLNEKTHWQTAVQVYISWAEIYLRRGALSRAFRSAADAHKLILLYGNSKYAFQINNLMAKIKHRQADYAEALALTENITQHENQAETTVYLTEALLISGMAAAALHQPDRAMNLLDQAEELAISQKQKQQLVTIWQAMATVYGEIGRIDLSLSTAQEAVTLAREIRVRDQIGIGLYRLSQAHLRFGEPQAALKYINEGLEIIEKISIYWQAYMLSHRAVIHIYEGHLKPAHQDLVQSIAIFESMDDPLGLLRARLILGVDYAPAAQDWSMAQDQLVRVGEIISSQEVDSQMYLPEAARLWLGLSQTAVYRQHWKQAKELLAKALRVIEFNKLERWRPKALFLSGLTFSQDPQDWGRARTLFKMALQLITEGENEDELPLILLHLGLVTTETDKKLQLFEASVAAAQKRSRFRDKLTCYNTVGPFFQQCDDARLRQIGSSCLAFVSAAQKSITTD